MMEKYIVSEKMRSSRNPQTTAIMIIIYVFFLDETIKKKKIKVVEVGFLDCPDYFLIII